ncbi:ATP-dependent Clp protease proteolytic subunit 5, chloroplastic-like isoform X2 [Durio zibethinus]|uniref:ATP-dependent Clp protease proteolytic subunit n=1 Tax=Durio zibethinus TaxID=66656 RepID=A0A6P5XIR1_DURZI|nr:ATP-dependent Clp protease proteolytic subunit 5, chloroplastic-like isoform X2 [Durio zibethinus]
MAQTCVSTLASSLRSTSLLFSPNSSPNLNSYKLSLPFHPLHPRKLKKLVSNQKNVMSSQPKAVSTGEFWPPETSSRQGIWSIRDDLQVPSSPYFPAYARERGPPPMVQERFHSVISQLFQQRIVRCGGPVDDDMANIIVAQLLYLDAVDPHKDIVMYVNSPGGSVTAGKRYSLPNSRMMIHQPLGGGQGTRTELEILVTEMMHHRAILSGYLSYHTGQSFDKITRDTELDFWMSPEDAMEYGLIDGVIMNPLDALQPLASTADSNA